MDIQIKVLLFLVHLLLSPDTHFSCAADTLSAGLSLFANQTLISKQGNFELGFFQPGSCPKYYVAIWYYKISTQNKTSVWVANRDEPLIDLSSSELKLLENGNLVILNQSKTPVWSTSSTSNAVNSSELVLGDDGNLVLRDASNPSVVFWQSFDHPGNTWLPGGKLGFDAKTKSATFLVSWKNVDDPAQGMFNVQLDPYERQFVILSNGSSMQWSSGAWDGHIFSLVPEMRLNYIYNFSYISNENESYFTYSVYNKSIFSRLVMNSSGQVEQTTWLDNGQAWNLFWCQPRKQCDVCAHCGAYSICDEQGLPYCQCLPGFHPRFPTDWNNLNDFSGGCVRKTSQQCEETDGFWIVSNVIISEDVGSTLTAPSEEDCKTVCLNKCSCKAFIFNTTSSKCSIWDEDLLNVRYSPDYIGVLRLRLSADEILSLNSGKKGKPKLVFIIPVVVGVLIVGVLLYIFWRRALTQRGTKKNIENSRKSKEITSKFSNNPDLQIFSFEKLAIATNNFDSANKLGQGGFGPVYKGHLSDGQEIAVKRLSKSSGQGLEEFKNEVMVISKLQHRNLVRLLGCCIEGEDKMLIYEYMPNKSLDAFIFDSTKQAFLDWTKRFEIIMGICEGIIYLHRDSRLRVIHRDLKASNILLDHELIPKISDFGMARIFGVDELQQNTLRVVGTYGYMSPEYAMKGVFSEKSDVYSFGVLLLELVSGRKNTSFYHNEQSSSLLRYAWKLWGEGKKQELIDPVISESSFQEEILRCIHVGLLCVQEFAKDRPTMSSVVSMLTGEITNLDIPKQPAFIGRPDASDSGDNRKTYSINSVSLTAIEGR